MKHTDLLEAMGEIDSRYIEDAAAGFGGRTQRLLHTVMRPAAAVAAFAILSFTAYTVCSVVRDGISQNTQSGYGETSADASPPVSEITEQTSGMQTEITAQMSETVQTETVPAETKTPIEEQISIQTSPPDLSEYVKDLPEMPAVPEYDHHPKTEQTFRTNGICASGNVLITVGAPEIYDNMNDAGLTLADMTPEYQDISAKHPDSNNPSFDSVSGEIIAADPVFCAQYCFVKTAVTIQNIDGISNRTLYNPDPESGRNLGYPPNFAGDYDFNASQMHFGFIPNADNLTAETTNLSHQVKPCYFSLTGVFERPTNEGTLWVDGQWFHLEPQQEITFEIGAFLPKTATEMIAHFWGIPEGESILPYYAFFTGEGRERPYVEFHLEG